MATHAERMFVVHAVALGVGRDSHISTYASVGWCPSAMSNDEP
jgi:hypothetical protein